MCMVSIQEGLPEVEDEEMDEYEHQFQAQDSAWTCPTCKVLNNPQTNVCWCKTARPKFVQFAQKSTKTQLQAKEESIKGKKKGFLKNLFSGSK